MHHREYIIYGLTGTMLNKDGICASDVLMAASAHLSFMCVLLRPCGCQACGLVLLIRLIMSVAKPKTHLPAKLAGLLLPRMFGLAFPIFGSSGRAHASEAIRRIGAQLTERLVVLHLFQACEPAFTFEVSHC